MNGAIGMIDFRQILNIFENYSVALSMLDDYDHQRMSQPQGRKPHTFLLTKSAET